MQAEVDGLSAKVVYASWRSGRSVSSRPWCVGVDIDEGAVVIAVRGTFELNDFLADLHYQPTPFTHSQGTFPSSYSSLLWILTCT